MTTAQTRGDIAPYLIVMPHQEAVSEPSAYVLDTNVLIDVERFYFGHRSMQLAVAGSAPRSCREDLRRLLTAFAVRRVGGSVDLRYGFAACEIGVHRDGSVDAAAYRTAVHAAQRVVAWTEAQVDRAFSNRHACRRQLGAR